MGVDTQQPDCSDEDALIWYADVDGDGWGDESSASVDCEAPSGHVADSTDCDDADAEVFPGADEYCNESDDDCDGEVDEEDAVDMTTWYEDADGDGYGNSDAITTSCHQPPDHVLEGNDCDDADAERWPGAPEVCGDGVINDCELDTDEALAECMDMGEVSLAAADSMFLGEEEYDHAGGSVAGAGDVDGDGHSDVLVGAHGGDDGGYSSGTAYLLYGPITSRILDLSLADSKLVGEEEEDSATWEKGLSSAGDVDADGLDDILIGVAYHDERGLDAGAAYIVRGPLSGEIDLGEADAKLVGWSAGDNAGYAVSEAGDVDQDGFDDVVVGAYGYDTGGSFAGVVYLVSGPVTGTVTLTDADDGRLVGEEEGDSAGDSVAGGGDVDGDGYDDILVGAYANDAGGNSAGAAYLVLGPVSGETSLSSADAKFIGESAGDEAGTVAFAGDMDGDGLDDVLVGAPKYYTGSANTGAAYLLHGPLTEKMDLSLADAKLVGESDTDRAGYSVAAAGDVDGDGNQDLLVGAYGHDASGDNAGAAYLVLGPVSGSSSLAAAQVKYIGESAGDEAGRDVAGAWDTNDDGYDDILVGAYYNWNGGEEAGAAYLVLGMGI